MYYCFISFLYIFVFFPGIYSRLILYYNIIFYWKILKLWENIVRLKIKYK